MESIYLSIASYRDPYLQSTIDDAFAKAAYPERLSVGCFVQVLDGDPELVSQTITNDYDRKVKYKVINAGRVFSVSKCRNRALKWLTSKHDYVLQIDSHTRFAKDWDKILLKEISRLNSTRAILSCYPPGWYPKNNWDVYVNWSFTSWNLCQYNTEFSKKNFMSTYDLVPSLTDIPRDSDFPAKSWYLSGAFIFAPAEYYLTVQQPDWITFWGEELFHSLIAFTNGWDVYVPYNRPIYSLYQDDLAEGALVPNKIWKDFSEEWFSTHKLTTKHLINSIVNKTTGPGYLGTHRPVEELYDFLGYDLGALIKGWQDEYEAVH